MKLMNFLKVNFNQMVFIYYQKMIFTDLKSDFDLIELAAKDVINKKKK